MGRYSPGSFVLILLMGISVLAFDVRLARTESQTIVVPDDFPTIQEAINSAVDGDTILVTIGIYYENVVVNKTVSLVGEDSSTTIIDGNETGHVIDVVSDNVNITNFTVRRGGNTMFPDLDAGISLNNVKGCKISSNNITDNGCFGVHLLNSDQNTISGNNLTRNAMYAIDLTTSHNNTISSNAAIFNANIGIGMHVSSQENIIMGNMIISNIYGIDAAHVSENVISGNYLANNSEIGIWIQDYAVNNTVIGNNVTGSHYCIKIQEQANYNIISQNNIGRNDYGFYIVSSTQNSIHHNNVLSNSQQTYVALGSVNMWDDGYPSGGNYWSDYSGLDQFSGPYQNAMGSDGIGDAPYAIDVFNRDNYPLMHPWSSFSYDWTVDDDGPADFDTIQEAINNAADGDTVFVKAGTYYEHVVVNRTVSLVGEDVSTTIIDGNDTGHVLYVVRGSVNVTGFTVRNSGNVHWPDLDAGICLNGTTGCVISENRVVDNGFAGISLLSSQYNKIAWNNVSDTGWGGIHLMNSSRNTVFDNILDSNGQQLQWGGVE
jgi:parallel beta-helix repeat protein